MIEAGRHGAVIVAAMMPAWTPPERRPALYPALDRALAHCGRVLMGLPEVRLLVPTGAWDMRVGHVPDCRRALLEVRAGEMVWRAFLNEGRDFPATVAARIRELFNAIVADLVRAAGLIAEDRDW